MFGDRPYQRTAYTAVIGSPHCADSREMEVLKNCLEEFKYGDFSGKAKVVSLLDCPDFDVRQYAHQLFADVCCYDEVGHWERAIKAAEDEYEAYRVIGRLGLTLCPSIIPYLEMCVRAFSELSETSGFIETALRDIMPQDGPNKTVDYTLSAAHAYFSSRNDVHQCFYGGLPFHLGNMTKDLIVAVLHSVQHQCPLPLGSLGFSIEAITGDACPVYSGMIVVDDDVRKVLRYVERIAVREWKVGQKYFWSHIVPSSL